MHELDNRTRIVRSLGEAADVAVRIAGFDAEYRFHDGTLVHVEQVGIFACRWDPEVKVFEPAFHGFKLGNVRRSRQYIEVRDTAVGELFVVQKALLYHFNHAHDFLSDIDAGLRIEDRGCTRIGQTHDLVDVGQHVHVHLAGLVRSNAEGPGSRDERTIRQRNARVGTQVARQYQLPVDRQVLQGRVDCAGRDDAVFDTAGDKASGRIQ